MIFNGGELSLVEYSHNEILSTVRTEFRSPHLLRFVWRGCGDMMGLEWGYDRGESLLDYSYDEIFSSLRTEFRRPICSGCVGLRAGKGLWWDLEWGRRWMFDLGWSCAGLNLPFQSQHQTSRHNNNIWNNYWNPSKSDNWLSGYIYLYIYTYIFKSFIQYSVRLNERKQRSVDTNKKMAYLIDLKTIAIGL